MTFTVSKSGRATHRLGPPHVASIYQELFRVATTLSPELCNMYLYDIYVHYAKISRMRYVFVGGNDSLNMMQPLGEGTLPCCLF